MMKIVKGIVIGTVIATGVAMMYSDGMLNKKRMARRGRQLVKKFRF
ncbi:MAG: hypothetical protein FWC79_06430 [Oscillospiraceae bacterium]|nr:hypothetical protein [Oscillospiraceae bacterium]